MFNLSEFSATFYQNGGVQKTNLFSVELPIPNGLQNMTNSDGSKPFPQVQKNLKFYCQGTTLPGVKLATRDIKRYGYGPTETVASGVLFSEIALMFMGDGRGAIWSYFQTWNKFICNSDVRKGMNTATGLSPSGGSLGGTQFPYEMNYKSDYAVDATITTYDQRAQKTIQVHLREAFPIFVGDTPLNWGDNNNYMKIPVVLQYMDWYNDILIGGNNIDFTQGQNETSTISSLLGQGRTQSASSTPNVDSGVNSNGTVNGTGNIPADFTPLIGP